ADAERERIEIEGHTKVKATAEYVLTTAKPAQDHPYLREKGIKAFGDVRVYKGALVLPLRDAYGVLHSLQFISGTDKRFLRGGRINGCFFTISDKADGPIIICEGYATGASIHEASGHAVVCAMNCG